MLRHAPFLAAMLVTVSATVVAQTHTASTIIFTNEPGHVLNVVPGTSLGFQAGTGDNTAFGTPVLSPDEQHWVMYVTNNSPLLGNDTVLVSDGGLILQEGSAPPWPTGPGELVGSLSSDTIGFNDAGDLLIHNTTGPVPTAIDYVVTRVGTSWSVLAQENMPVGATCTLVGNAVGTATWGTSSFGLNACNLTNAGTPMWIATGILGLSTGTTNNAAVVLGLGACLQKGVSVPFNQAGGALETWENFDQSDLYVSPDGSLVMVQGDLTGATTTDDVLVLNDAVLVQEGFPFGAMASPVATITKPWIDRGGAFFVRASNADNSDWTMRNGNIVAVSGGTQEVVSGSGIHWSDVAYSPCFFGFDGNASGHYVIGGLTDAIDPGADAMIVWYDGLGQSAIAVREGQAIDLDGNGLLDDDRYVASFANDRFLLRDDDSIMLTCTLRNAAGTSVSRVFLTLSVPAATCTSYNGNGVNPVVCTCATPPALGTNWTIDVGMAANTLQTFAFAAAAPLPPLPLFGGEALIQPPFVDLGGGGGTHPVPLPAGINLAGFQLFVQGLRLNLVGSSLALQLTNAQQAVLGQ